MYHAYIPETADEVYGEIRRSHTFLPAYAKAYALLAQIFTLFINQQTAAVALNFAGPFAKTDYLLKEHNADNKIRRNINETRARLTQHYKLPQRDAENNFLHDLKHLCQFVALVTGETVPADLHRLFPADREHVRCRVLTDSMRAIVTTWDDIYFRCRIDGYNDGEEVTVCYNERAERHDDNLPGWSYLSRMFYAGAQVNIVRPRLVGDELHAELFIFEPDYLVDISAVARCFTHYAESPYVNLVNTLKPNDPNEYGLLGNFASQLLDEELHQLPADHSYAQSATDFFRHNALQLLVAQLPNDFHDNARRQATNIHRAVSEGLSAHVRSFNRRECIVEPSFFCEMLGLQGRMDMLQLDFRVLLEQKSGKGEYPQGDFSTPRHKEDHYVQLLLYLAVLRYGFRDVYERNNREIHAFLLYSKYTDSLLGLGFAPQLFHRALRVRNALAWSELQFAEHDGLRILERLTPEMLNQKKAKGTLWENYTRRELTTLFAPIHSASVVEREYYFRFLTFVAQEHLLAKFGNKTKENSGFASHWHSSFVEKLQTGDIYAELRILRPEPQAQRTAVESVEFLLPASAEMGGSSNFRVGDIVAFYPYPKDGEPDIRRSIVFRGSLSAITEECITIQLRAPQIDFGVFDHFDDSLWAVEHDFMESSYSTMYRNLHAFLSAPQERRDLLMMQRPPRVTEGRQLRGDYGTFNTLSQRVKEADELFLIIGPPGTGKTSFGMLNTLVEALAEPGDNVLLLSFTNRAVDEICSKLVEENIDFLRIGRTYNTPEAYQPYLLEQRLEKCSKVADVKAVIEGQRVFVSTTSTLSANLHLLRLKDFALAIIDEASQILEPDLIGILSATRGGVAAIRKFVFIGDHKQLPAVVQQSGEESRVDHPALREIGLRDCRSSLFERLLSRYGQDPRVTYMLTRQGRMHPAIAEFVNGAFYGGRLDIVPLPHQLEEGGQRLTFIDVPQPVDSPSDKVNLDEAKVIAGIVKDIYDQSPATFDPLQTVGVIVPYRNQITAVRNALAATGLEGVADITIDTVERYQGSQRDNIIYGFTVQRHYQLNFLTDNTFEDTDGTLVDRKLNVALTRAQRHMYIVGNRHLLTRNPLFRRLIEAANCNLTSLVSKENV